MPNRCVAASSDRQKSRQCDLSTVTTHLVLPILEFAFKRLGWAVRLSHGVALAFLCYALGGRQLLGCRGLLLHAGACASTGCAHPKPEPIPAPELATPPSDPHSSDPHGNANVPPAKAEEHSHDGKRACRQCAHSACRTQDRARESGKGGAPTQRGDRHKQGQRREEDDGVCHTGLHLQSTAYITTGRRDRVPGLEAGRAILGARAA